MRFTKMQASILRVALFEHVGDCVSEWPEGTRDFERARETFLAVRRAGDALSALGWETGATLDVQRHGYACAAALRAHIEALSDNIRDAREHGQNADPAQAQRGIAEDLLVQIGAEAE